MAAVPLQNYIKMYRKWIGFSQDEVAFLMGDKATGGSRISRYERFQRTPALEKALALEIILDVPVGEIFPGEKGKAKQIVEKRAKVLREKVIREEPSAMRDQRLRRLNELILNNDEEYDGE